MENGRNGCIIHPYAQIGMKALLKGVPALMVLAAVLLCILMFPQAAQADAVGAYNTNLVVNGNASISDTPMVGWTTIPEPVFKVFNPADFLLEPYSSNGGNVFDFFPETPVTETLTQTIDITNLASDINAGAVNIRLSAETRKFLSSGSNMIRLELLDYTQAILERHDKSGTISNSNWEMLTIDLQSIRTGTRYIRVTLSATVVDNSYTDYIEFDGIDLKLTKTVQTISSASVGGIVAPAAGQIPITKADLTTDPSNYTVTDLDWYHISGNPPHWINGRFCAEYSYMAIIELTASAARKFEDTMSPLPVNGVYAGNVYGGDVEGNKLLFTITFPTTEALSVTGITTISQPVLSYVEGQALDLTGLQVTLTYNDTSTATVTPDQFAAKGVTANPANGTVLSLLHNGQQVSLTANGHTSYTNAMSMTAATYTIEANPTPLIFSNAVLGYGSAPAAQTVTITNTGNSSVTLTQPTSTNYVLGALSSTTLSAGASATFTVRPKTGLNVGTHGETITVNTDHSTSAGVNLTFTVESPTYTIALSPDSLNFGSTVEGYMFPPMSQMVTISNTGNSPVTISTAPTATGYTIMNVFPMTIDAGDTGFFNIEPDMSLVPGTYNETLTLYTDQGTSASVDVSFTVDIAVYSMTASPSSLDLGIMVEGSPFPPMGTMVSIEITGNAPVTIASAPVSLAFSIMAPFPMTIEDGMSIPFFIEPKSGLAPGVYNETLVFQTVQGASASVDVSFTVQAATYTVEAGTDSLSFGSAIEGYAFAPAPQIVGLTNTGNSDVTINVPASANYDIILIGPAGIFPTGMTLFQVQPKTGLDAGTYNETITFSTTNGTSDSVNLTFTVQDATYTVEADAGSLSFGSMVEGYAFAPAAQTVTITNTGNSAVTFSAAPTASDYDIMGPFPVTIPAGFFFTFGVQPKTGLAAGPHNQTITLSTDHGTSASLDLAFTVNAATYTITASPSSLNFESVIEGYPAAPASQTVTVTNTGNSIVTISSAPMAAAYDIAGTFPRTIVAGGTDTFNIRPKLGLAPGTHNWTIVIITDHSTSASVNAAFTVDAATYTITASPVSLNFGSAIEGYPAAPASQTVTVTNTGNSPVTISSAPTAENYDLAGTFPMTIAAGGTDTFTVQPKLGLAVGAHNETIVLNTDLGTSTGVDAAFTVQAASYAVEADTHSVSFGSVIEGYAVSPAAQTVIITNMGNKAVTLTAPINARYDITALDPLTLTPAASARFTVQPKTGLGAGTYNETIALSTTSSTYDSVDVSFTVQAASYAVEADTHSVSFGSVIEGYASAPAAQTATITNTGNKAVTLTVPTNARFDITALDALTLAPAASARFTVQPKTGLGTGAYNETIAFSTASATSDSITASFTVQAASYTIEASPLLINFQSTAQGEAPPAAQTITVTNTGNKPVTLIQPTGTNLTVGMLTAIDIEPLEEAAFTIQPKAGLTEGIYFELLEITGSNGTSAQVEVRFTVTLPPSYEISASPNSLAFDSLAEGYIQPDSKLVTVTNTGNQSISLYQPTSVYYRIGTLSATTLAPGDSATFTVVPKPGLSAQSYNEAVHILGSMGVNTQVEVTFTCIEPNDDYEILSGDGSTFQQDDPGQSSFTISANGHLSNFTGLTINGELVDESNYDVEEGSTIVTLHQDFLDTLQPGTYTLRFHYTDGFADAGFVVQDKMPVTGDNDVLLLFGALMVLSLAAIMLLKRKAASR